MSWRRPRPGSSGWKKSENWAEPRFSQEIQLPAGLARATQSLYGAAALGILT
jgi:hypothetical protein